ncbi:GNAT family N-acetyltransferase [Alkalihalobacillus sp. AL-G]|uniref:GNAT family N-acetyltransferase n=1 Tax=Alkalihalobacillus sp. AL-G TaxID=2926399 RepID=UPI00272BC59A|nr:GNAT family N-acetyltransferase [Alkalihalobacillus sp. AL-G]WLD93794.1 GNAT family N-acetyltransferase [Alkalihalobacillus sp. AL-G]
MITIEISRPAFEDVEELNRFFRLVVVDTFAQEGLSNLVEDIEDEIETKKKYLKMDLNSNGDERYFLIAKEAGGIVGCIEYGTANELILSNTNGKFEDIPEVGTVFVHPEYRRQGIANKILHAMYNMLHEKGIEEFCLDSGYTIAQQVWKKKFDEPDYLLKDYWGEGLDHMIWKIPIRPDL